MSDQLHGLVRDRSMSGHERKGDEFCCGLRMLEESVKTFCGSE